MGMLVNVWMTLYTYVVSRRVHGGGSVYERERERGGGIDNQRRTNRHLIPTDLVPPDRPNQEISCTNKYVCIACM